MSEHIIPKKTYYSIFAILMILLGVTVGAAYIQLGPFNIVAAVIIATVKAVIIIMYFMHVKYSSRITWVFIGAGFFCLVILLALLSADYVSRDWLPVPTAWE